MVYGGDWHEDNSVWHQNVFAYYLSISCLTTAKTGLYQSLSERRVHKAR
ncbi:hypothetical protein KCP73_02580 [Salmonella enterica subsp. enterica]|nr:hypothetical protein KCP73_02580 [Salmonella enterica subsp. enterica]